MLEIVCQSAPDNDKPNEDAFIAYQHDDRQPRYALGAIDGATSVAFYEPLRDYLDAHHNGITPAALSATIARDAILTYLGTLAPSSDISPTDLIIHANQVLRDFLDDVAPNIFSAETIIAEYPHHAELLDDPRKIRLFLPAAVATLAVIDTDLNTLYYGHIGDTALILCYPDGYVEVPTRDQVQSKAGSALYAAVQEVAGNGLTMEEVVNHPLLRALDRDQRIYHNYVDENGQTAPQYGTGVINGLPVLTDYIRTNVISLDDAEAVLLVSDGFLLPDNPLNPRYDLPTRASRMWQMIRQHGMRQYLNHLRAEERADSDREKYPRLKLHDDATGVLLYLDD